VAESVSAVGGVVVLSFCGFGFFNPSRAMMDMCWWFPNPVLAIQVSLVHNGTGPRNREEPTAAGAVGPGHPRGRDHISRNPQPRPKPWVRPPSSSSLSTISSASISTGTALSLPSSLACHRNLNEPDPCRSSAAAPSIGNAAHTNRQSPHRQQQLGLRPPPAMSQGVHPLPRVRQVH